MEITKARLKTKSYDFSIAQQERVLRFLVDSVPDIATLQPTAKFPYDYFVLVSKTDRAEACASRCRLEN